ncbi:MAG: c-type cytochrome [Rhizobiales bacterium]|nr:c-type cytochrome [Hyphomicrobiales bacterium]
MMTTPYSLSAAEGDVGRGQRVYGACAACHSLEPNRNMTGPSLAELWNRTAGGLASFRRYSPALKSSRIIWEDRTLDEWLKNPQQFIPGNQMTFPGLKNEQQRADLVAFLKVATQPGHPLSTQGQSRGGMGMMGGGEAPNLKKIDPKIEVSAITLCQDTYRVTTADGNTREFWERNLRFKTDSSDDGPAPGRPAILRAGMMGDRAAVIFALPNEISAFIAHKC